MDFRTDLALERRELAGCADEQGVRCTEYEKDGTNVTEIEVLDERGVKAIGKQPGRYITVDVPPFTMSSELTDGRLSAVTEILRSMIPEEGTVLVAGLGNLSVTPDSLGPKCAQMVLATRHLTGELARGSGLDALRSTAVIAPGVLGQTGMETSEIISAVCEKIKPCAVICVDALASLSTERLARTVQLSDTGVEPGSGVGNTRAALNEQTLGVPVIAVGVPTVVDALSIARDVTGDVKADDEKLRKYSEMTVAPRETDIVIASASKLLALALNCALQRSLEPAEVLSLMA